MPTRSVTTAADTADLHFKLLAVALLLFSLKYAVSASMHFTGDGGGRSLDLLELVLTLGGVAMILPICLWKLRQFWRLSPGQRAMYFSMDSFAAEAMRKGRSASWAATFVTLIVLEIASRSWTELPSEFFLQVAVSIMLGVFAVTYLVASSTGNDSETKDAPDV